MHVVKIAFLKGEKIFNPSLMAKTVKDQAAIL